uniref:RING-type domain-containing protein n=1 Tax=Aplanochytrium stocchinoi TaxID=215587 RepID=A0A7S3PR51_9STRA
MKRSFDAFESEHKSAQNSFSENNDFQRTQFGGNCLTTCSNLNVNATIVPPGFETISHPIFQSQRSSDFESSISFECSFREQDELCTRRVTRQKSKRQRHIECPICFGCVCDPVTPDSCPHTFCLSCIRLWARQCYKLQQLPSCPICKRRIQTFTNIQGETVPLNLFPKSNSNRLSKDRAQNITSRTNSLCRE